MSFKKAGQVLIDKTLDISYDVASHTEQQLKNREKFETSDEEYERMAEQYHSIQNFKNKVSELRHSYHSDYAQSCDMNSYSFSYLSDEELNERQREVGKVKTDLIKFSLEFDKYKRNMKMGEMIKYSLSNQFDKDRERMEKIDEMIEKLNEEHTALLDEKIRRRNEE